MTIPTHSSAQAAPSTSVRLQPSRSMPKPVHRFAGASSGAGSRDERGQATAEYALLTGAIAVVVTAVTAWAASTGKIARLLDVVFDHLVRAVG